MSALSATHRREDTAVWGISVSENDDVHSQYCLHSEIPPAVVGMPLVHPFSLSTIVNA